MDMDRAIEPPTKDQGAAGFSKWALEQLHEGLDAEIEAGRLPGAVVMVARHGRLEFVHAGGWLDKAKSMPMTEDALFRLFSMTKPFTSVAALMLVEQESLSLKDKVVRYLPELGAAWRATSVEHLLLHASGLTYGMRSAHAAVRKSYVDLGIPVNPRGIAPEAFLKSIAQVPLLHAPGTTWEYGLSTDLLGLLIERCTGRRLGVWLDAHVFKPLGMTDTSFQVDPAQAARIAQPFSVDPVDGAPLKIPDQTFDPVSPAHLDSGGAGAISTAGDYLRFASMLSGGGRLGSIRLLREDTVQHMTKDHIAGKLAAPVTPGQAAMQLSGYGFGLGFGVRLSGNPGDAPGSPGMFFWSGTGGTMFWVDPKEELVVVYMTQAPGLSRQHYRRWIMTRVYEALEVRRSHGA
jgi:CubicO group peptidase (beta-lactamase class C family)